MYSAASERAMRGLEKAEGRATMPRGNASDRFRVEHGGKKYMAPKWRTPKQRP